MRDSRDTGTRSAQPTVLALRALGLGDLLTGVPALRGLRRRFPDHRLLLATSPPLAPLVKDMEIVDGMLATGELEPLRVQFDPDDVAVNLHGRGPQSTERLLETSPRHLVAFAHPDIPATFGSPPWRRHEHERARWCRLLRHHDVDARPEDVRLDPPDRGPFPSAGATVIHPGASAAARLWPPDKWARLARHLADAGETVVVTGSPSEVPLATVIAREAGLPDEWLLAGETDVLALAALVASARCLISSDTGPAHLATAYGTPSVTLFGPTSPDEWGPPADDRHRVIWKGSTGDPNGAVPHQGLLDITVDEVVDALPFSRTFDTP